MAILPTYLVNVLVGVQLESIIYYYLLSLLQCQYYWLDIFWLVEYT